MATTRKTRALGATERALASALGQAFRRQKVAFMRRLDAVAPSESATTFKEQAGPFPSDWEARITATRRRVARS